MIIQRDVANDIAYTKQLIDNLAIIHVLSCNDVLALQKMASLHVHAPTTFRAAYFILHVPVPTITCLLLRTCLQLYTFHVHYAVGSLPLANNAMHSLSIYYSHALRNVRAHASSGTACRLVAFSVNNCSVPYNYTTVQDIKNSHEFAAMLPVFP